MFDKPWLFFAVLATSFLCFQCRSSQNSTTKNVSEDQTFSDSSCRSWTKTFKSNGDGLSKIFDGDLDTDQRACTLAIENSIESILREKNYASTNRSCLGELTCSISTADGSKWGILEDAMSFQPFGDKTVSKEKANTSCILSKNRVGESSLYMRTAKTIGIISCNCICIN